ncbi:4Fe-4S dicluster domain-containing protein [Brevibacterium sp.]|uniref:4Fe-4S dicluster domain-containing protein n=1 Tax=Brevibacterium sp. TaxID=1701 RepID=UPI0025BED9EA|nr:4Fe-4S dicluster domain-containing protein [Brevibacterium sp.]
MTEQLTAAPAGATARGGAVNGGDDPIAAVHWGAQAQERKGFFTDTSICIGCKACEVACKEWNRNPQDGTFELLGSSYDNTGGLGANTWRHVAFIEQDGERIAQARESGRRLVGLGMPTVRPPDGAAPDGTAVGGTPAAAARAGGCGSHSAQAAGGCGSGTGGCACGGPAGAASAAGPAASPGVSGGADQNLGGPLGELLDDSGAGPVGLAGSLASNGLAAHSPASDGSPAPASGGVDVLDPGGEGSLAGVDTTPPDTADFRWLMSSDVCKHCTHAGCLDVCPTGALFRTEFGTVVVQNDVCNGCGTCVAGCPFGVIERRDDGTINTPTQRDRKAAEMDVPDAGTANKCTLCYDRLVDGQTPACAQTCPTTSIKFGDRDDMVDKARARVKQLHAQGLTEARLYGANPHDGVGGTGSVFLLLDEPEVYGLPPDPRVATKDLPGMFATAGIAALGMVAAAGLAFLGGRR